MDGSGALRVFLAVVCGVALIGFLRGTTVTDDDLDDTTTQGADVGAAAVDGVSPARSYRELRDSPRGEGSGWAADLDALAALGPDVTDAVSLEGVSKSADLAARASRRAYDGAPPRIPHAVRQDAAPECLTCHEDGLRFRGLLATPMSHTSYTSCTQCHVVDEAPMPGGADLPPDPRAVENTFVGLASPTAGPRAWAVAPPQIPHRTWMREECDSCHGVNGRDALRSTHPARANCEQCHAASATIDQRPGVAR
ncbi:MAG: diheme cytochrome c precursor [Pseudomonadota bacterium]|nr:diheme cytochrome c precursor [Pseudomonadota bacterium]